MVFAQLSVVTFGTRWFKVLIYFTHYSVAACYAFTLSHHCRKSLVMAGQKQTTEVATGAPAEESKVTMTRPVGSKTKVAVIGAGAAGLCSARHLIEEKEIFEFSVFEREDDVGGTWQYTEKTGLNEHGLPIHSSMYQNLRTNLPKEVMAFPGFPFQHMNGKSFIHHTDVLKYLKDYAESYDLYRYIKFHTLVKNVQPLDVSVPDPKWIVETQNLITRQETSDVFDAVMVCNGHYSVPYMPNLPGLNEYEGVLLHSHEYRNNSMFKGLKVVVLGAGASGIDIAVEVSDVAQEVILSHNLPPRTTPLPKNLTQEVGIESVCQDSVTFLNGRKYSCDALLLCTGYLYTYPFLHKSCNLRIGAQRVQPLYRHLFHIDHPTLGIWAVPKQIVPFPIYDQQVKVFLKFLKGEFSLPSRDEMVKDEEEDFQGRLKNGMSERNAHTMRGEMQFEYDKQLSALGSVTPLPDVLRRLYLCVHGRRKENVLQYKEFNYKIIDDENFVESSDDS